MRAAAEPPRVYRVAEYAPADVPLKDLVDKYGHLHLNPDVEAKGYFTVQLVKGRVRLQAAGHVGLIPLNERVVIDVVPRAPIGNLSRLLRISEHDPDFLLTERGYEHADEWNESLLDLYAETLVARVEAAASSGLLRDYKREEADTSFPRGRVRLGPTYSRLRARGLPHKVVATWFERTADNPPNRCLKYALWFTAGRLSQLGPLTAARRDLLLRLGVVYELFKDVPVDHSLGFLKNPVVRGGRQLPSLRTYYRPALDISVSLILERAVRLEGEKTAVELPSLVLNMNRVFEAYLRNVLRAAARDDDWRVRVLDGNYEGKKLLFDEQPSVDATPDIVFRDLGSEGTPLVIEVKNIPTQGQSKRDAIEQAVTYAASYRCKHVVLAHPRAHGQSFSGLRVQGRLGTIAVYQYVFDLAAESLDKEEARLSQTVSALVDQSRAKPARSA